MLLNSWFPPVKWEYAQVTPECSLNEFMVAQYSQSCDPLFLWAGTHINDLREINDCSMLTIKCISQSNSDYGQKAHKRYKELIVMTGKFVWFEGTPFPSLDYSSELLKDMQESFLVKDEDILLLTFSKSGKEAGSGADRLWQWPSFIQ